MKVCRWCRMPIVEAWERQPDGELLASWIHHSGFYTCPTHPETMAEPADERWEKVWASIGVPEYDSYIPEMFKDVLEFRIEVIYKGTVHYQVFRAHKNDLMAYVGGENEHYKLILDRMVTLLDAHLDSFDAGVMG